MPAFRTITHAPKLVSAALPTRNMPCFRAISPQMHHGPAMAMFPGLAHELSPLFNVFEEFEHQATHKPSVRSFQPRFDVREEQDAFHLQGELPGIEPENIQIEFADEHTLVVRGRTMRESSTKGKAPVVEAATLAETSRAIDEAQPDNASTHSSKYHKPTVEGEGEEWTEAVVTPATTNTEVTTKQDQQVQAEKADETPQAKYWVNERVGGQFHRNFKFPGRLDQEAVSARLTNGILDIVVPKAAKQAPKRIVIQ